MSMPRLPYLTSRAHDAFSRAHDLADRRGDDGVTPVHVTLGMLEEGRNLAVEVLYRLGVSLDDLKRDLDAQLPPPTSSPVAARAHSWTPGDERMVEGAKLEASELGTEFYACEHLLLAFLRDGTDPAAQVLERHGLHYDRIRAMVRHVYDERAGEAPPASPPP
jgi:ATP-dependent Clp protease ATP-binding subunit ClpC